MATFKKLRTPIIKPRTQGGTFYTFGSAMEDIGLNINDKSNRIELSHYLLMKIPTFTASTLHTTGTYSEHPGDYILAETFQNYILNMETVLRNQSTYNYAATKTVSERVFWKAIMQIGQSNSLTFDASLGCYYENSNDPIAKAFGRIYSGSQRGDEYGLYNETFVQIPSSYGQMRVFFKPTYDENYKLKTNDNHYYSSNKGIIEGIASDEYDASTKKLTATGIPATGIFDNTIGTSYYSYSGTNDKHFLEAVIDIDSLKKIYNDSTITYDKIGFGDVIDPIKKVTASTAFGDFAFNAILIYYSIYDSTGTNLLATNAYGVYILDNAVVDGMSTSGYKFPTLLKKKTTTTADGTSFSFRLNIKPSSAYSGDIVVSDNSSGGFSMAEDFNDVLRNLNTSITTLKSNARLLQEIVENNKELRSFASDAIDKVNEVESSIEQLKVNGYIYKDCDTLVSYKRNTKITDNTEISVLKGAYKNLRLSDGTVVSRTVVSGNYNLVYLAYNTITVNSDSTSMKRMLCGYQYNNSDATFSAIGPMEIESEAVTLSNLTYVYIDGEYTDPVITQDSSDQYADPNLPIL